MESEGAMRMDRDKIDRVVQDAVDSVRGAGQSVCDALKDFGREQREPGWKIRCPKCGNTKDFSESGGIRIGACSRGGKSTMAWCTNCRKMVRAQIFRENTPPKNGDSEQTWQELTSYVSEGSMSAATAETIASAPAPEHRKREVAAHIAEGALSVEDAMRLLRMP